MSDTTDPLGVPFTSPFIMKLILYYNLIQNIAGAFLINYGPSLFSHPSFQASRTEEVREPLTMWALAGIPLILVSLVGVHTHNVSAVRVYLYYVAATALLGLAYAMNMAAIHMSCDELQCEHSRILVLIMLAAVTLQAVLAAPTWSFAGHLRGEEVARKALFVHYDPESPPGPDSPKNYFAATLQHPGSRRFKAAASVQSIWGLLSGS